MKSKVTPIRILFYLIGMILLALGICLNTKTTLGVSPIISVAYVFHSITGMAFADATLLLYILFVVIEVVIHILRKTYKSIISDVLQILVSVIFTRFVAVFDVVLPEFETRWPGQLAGSIYSRIFFLIIAIALTGIGVAFTLNMHLVPNPGDGIVQAISDCIGKDTGFCKNCVDISCFTISAIVSFIVFHSIVGIGIGTICAMIGTGRVIAIFNHFFKKPMEKIAKLNSSL